MSKRQWWAMARSYPRPEGRGFTLASDNPEIIKPIKEVEFLYEQDVNDLKGEAGDWHHGFNSGALAALRYMLTITDFGIESAEEEFPFLDT